MIKPRINQGNKDLEVVHELHREINCLGVTENAIVPKNANKENYKPRTLIDQTLELIDPTPNIHTLFVQFNARFFWNILLPVEVKWSNRMTSCAGVCTFHSRNRQCVISLSAPLLKLRPRKDLVETLLHEMIHGYLFLTNNNRDRDGHGPEFCKHMHRINKEAGTNITIYHSFHDEVKLYQQHWWRCNGSCQKRGPYFGMVRRAMNRAPGPSDFWWQEHQRTCGGQFIKIKEPENTKNNAKNKKNNTATKPSPKSTPAKENIFDWLKKTNSSSISTPKQKDLTDRSNTYSNNSKNVKTIDSKNGTIGINKLGNMANNVHRWSKSSNSPTVEPRKTSTPKFSCSGTLGGSNTNKSNLLDRFVNINQGSESRKSNLLEKLGNTNYNHPNTVKSNDQNNAKIIPVKSDHQTNSLLSKCPVCNTSMTVEAISEHIDSCLSKKNNVDETIDLSTPVKRNPLPQSTTGKRKQTTNNILLSTKEKQKKLENSKPTEFVSCPVCRKNFEFTNINEHLDEYLTEAENKPDESINSPLNTSPTIERSKNNVTLSSSRDSIADTDVNDIMVISSSSCDSNIDLVCAPGSSSQTDKFSNERTSKSDGNKCLICNTLIPPTVSLNDHLEECINEVFHDKSSFGDDFDNEVENTIDNKDEYPCPVCMKLIHESVMNVHLDSCLKED